MSAGRSSNVLKRLAALLVPVPRPGLDRVGGGVEQLVEALPLVGLELARGRGRDRCGRVADPDRAGG